MRALRVVAAASALLAACAAARAETEYHQFVGDYMDFLEIYSDAAEEPEMQSMRSTALAMQYDDLWLQQSARALFESVNYFASDPGMSKRFVIDSALFAMKGLSKTEPDGKTMTHRLTKEERQDLLARLHKLQETKWVQGNPTVVSALKILASFLKSDDLSKMEPDR